MVMETNARKLATHNLALLIVKAVGASTLTVPPRVVVASKNVCTASPPQLIMVVPFVPRRRVLRRPMLAAQNHVKRIVKVTGRIGASAPMVAMVQMAWNVVREVNKAEFSRSMLHPPRVDVLVTTSMETLTPDLATCLAAPKIVKVLGASLDSVFVMMESLLSQPLEKLKVNMEKLKHSAVAVGQRQKPSQSQRRRSVVVNAVMLRMVPSRVRDAVKHHALLTARVTGKNLQSARPNVVQVAQQSSTGSLCQPHTVGRNAHTRMVHNMMTLVN